MIYGPGVYEFTIKAKSGSKNPLETDFIVELTLIDPCITAAFTFDPAILPTPYEYVVSFPKDVQTLLDSAITSSEKEAICPDIIFSVTNQDTTAIDPTVFVFSPMTQTLSTESADKTKIGIYPMTV